MKVGMRIVGVILAAGEGRRMGLPKALLRLGDRSFLALVAASLRRPGIERSVAVVGAGATRAREEIEGTELAFLENPRAADGMLSSVRCGLLYAEELGADAVLLHPVDHPMVAPATIDRVVDALMTGARIAVPSWQGRRGHPAGFAAAAWPALHAAPLDLGARAVLTQHPDWVTHVAGDPGCRAGVNTPEDYDALCREWTGEA
jgi:molybdenum cofactor cytidylyltransferase